MNALYHKTYKINVSNKNQTKNNECTISQDISLDNSTANKLYSELQNKMSIVCLPRSRSKLQIVVDSSSHQPQILWSLSYQTKNIRSELESVFKKDYIEARYTYEYNMYHNRINKSSIRTNACHECIHKTSLTHVTNIN